MKNLSKIIIMLVCIFSNIAFTFASENGEIGDLLDIENSSIKEELSKINTKNYSFSDENTKKIYEKFKNLDVKLKGKIYELIDSGEYSYYRSKGIITTYKNFVYRVNKTFEYLSLKEKNNNAFVQIGIEKNKELAKTHYKRLQYLVSKK